MCKTLFKNCWNVCWCKTSDLSPFERNLKREVGDNPNLRIRFSPDKEKKKEKKKGCQCISRTPNAKLSVFCFHNFIRSLRVLCLSRRTACAGTTPASAPPPSSTARSSPSSPACPSPHGAGRPRCTLSCNRHKHAT